MTRPIVKILTGFAVLAGLVVVGAIFFALSQTVPVPPRLPNPNGYEDLVKAAGMLDGDFLFLDYSTMSHEELVTVVAKNGEALSLARKGLDRESRVPLDYSATNSAHLNGLSHLKRLAHAFVAQGRLAEMEHHPREAAQEYLDAIRLGHAVSRGGVIIDSFVGLAVETLGLASLEKLSSDLDAKQCREVASALEAAEGGREDVRSDRAPVDVAAAVDVQPDRELDGCAVGEPVAVWAGRRAGGGGPKAARLRTTAESDRHRLSGACRVRPGEHSDRGCGAEVRDPIQVRMPGADIVQHHEEAVLAQRVRERAEAAHVLEP